MREKRKDGGSEGRSKEGWKEWERRSRKEGEREEGKERQ